MVEWTISSHKLYKDPFNDVDVDVVFSKDGHAWRVPTFWRGGHRWTVRFAPPSPGRYSYRLQSTDPDNPDLNGHEGSVSVTAYSGSNELLRHGALRVSSNGRYFEHVDGRPFYWLGDTWWTGLSDRLNWEGFKELAADRREKGFTVVQLVAGLIPTEELPPLDPGYGNEGGPVWDAKFERINPKYFDFADRRIQHLVDIGITPAIVGAWRELLTDLGVAKMKQHWRYIIARYGAYPVFWILGGELIDPPENVVKQMPSLCSSRIVRGWTDVALYLRANDPYHHPITAHEFPPPCDFPLTDETLTDFDMFQAGHADWRSIGTSIGLLNRHYARTTMVKPLVQGEIGYERLGETHLEDFQRAAFWFSMLNGAAGHTYGAIGTYEAYTNDRLFQRRRYSFLSWKEGMKLPGSYQVGLGAKLLRQYRWWLVAPHPEWVSPRGTTALQPHEKINGMDLGTWESSESSDDLENAPAPEDSEKGPDGHKATFRRPYAAGIPDEVRFIYMPYLSFFERTPPTVLALEPTATYDAFFWQPALGMRIPLGTVRRPPPGPTIFEDPLPSAGGCGWRVANVPDSRDEGLTEAQEILLLQDVRETNAVAAVNALSSEVAALVLRYQDGANYVAATYSPSDSSLYVIERQNGLSGPTLGRTEVRGIGRQVRLRAEVRDSKAIASLDAGEQTFTTPIIDLSKVTTGSVGLLTAGNRDRQRFENFELRRSPVLIEDQPPSRELFDAQGRYRGRLSGEATVIGGKRIPGWGDFGRDKHILLDAYRPERMPGRGDWILVLEASKGALSKSEYTIPGSEQPLKGIRQSCRPPESQPEAPS